MVPCACLATRGVAGLSRLDLQTVSLANITKLIRSSRSRSVSRTRHGIGVIIRLWKSKVEESDIGTAIVACDKAFRAIYQHRATGLVWLEAITIQDIVAQGRSQIRESVIVLANQLLEFEL